MAETSYSDQENMHSLVTVLQCILCFKRIIFLRTYFTSIRSSLLLVECTQAGPILIAINVIIEKSWKFFQRGCNVDNVF